MADVSNSSRREQLKELKESLSDVPIVTQLVQICKTMDQAKSLAQIIDSLSEKNLK